MNPESQEHWQSAYSSKAASDVSWYEPIPQRSLELILATGLPHSAALIDVGGGASTLVDHLLSAGFGNLSVLDLAPAALAQSKARLGSSSEKVEWIEADVTSWRPERRYDLWHDRAVFHFLVDANMRDRYLATLRASLSPGGYVAIATFGPEGPVRCSGLETKRYSAEELTEVLGPDYRLVTSVIEEHRTPGGCMQQFLYGLWQSESRLETAPCPGQ